MAATDFSKGLRMNRMGSVHPPSGIRGAWLPRDSTNKTKDWRSSPDFCPTPIELKTRGSYVLEYRGGCYASWGPMGRSTQRTLRSRRVKRTISSRYRWRWQLSTGGRHGYRSYAPLGSGHFNRRANDSAHWVGWTCVLAADAVRRLESYRKLAERPWTTIRNPIVL